jgi:hypothetical protein
MLLSALALAALLQAAPDIQLKGYLVAPRLADRTQPVGELIMPVPRRAKGAAYKASTRSRAVSPFKAKPAPRPDFFRNQQMASCDSHGLTQAGHPEALTVQPLSKMPQAHGERAVARLVGGCPVAVMIAQR